MSDRHVLPPSVVWFTGLSGAGKTTIASAVHDALAGRTIPVEYLDGDRIRALFPGTGFTREERDAHVRRVGQMASRLEQDGITAICALISPYRDARREVRGLCRRFFEVHVSTPLAECERRDPKGLYARARRGEIRNFTGIDDVYEVPEAPELSLDTTDLPVDAAVTRVLSLIGAYDRCPSVPR
jgi:adenylylsulfate kinase